MLTVDVQPKSYLVNQTYDSRGEVFVSEMYTIKLLLGLSQAHRMRQS